MRAELDFEISYSSSKSKRVFRYHPRVLTHVLSVNQVSEMIASVVYEEIWPIRDKQ